MTDDSLLVKASDFFLKAQHTIVKQSSLSKFLKV